MIERCLLGKDDCDKCDSYYSCSSVSVMKNTEVDYFSKIMNNPFFGRYEIKNCLLLKIE